MSTTKDEQFILSLYCTVEESSEKSVFNRYEIGLKAGLQPKAVDAICKLLIRSNFIKKMSEEEIFITARGRELALYLLREK